MSGAVGLVWDLLARDQASPAFLKVAAAADRAAGATAKASASMSATTATMGKVGAKLTKSLTLPLLGLAAVSVDQAVKWQRSMTLIQTAGGETAAKAAAISKGLMGIAQETGTSLTALSDGIYTVAKAGAQKWSATEQLEIMKAAAEGAKAENVDLGTATNALTSVMMSYHLAASKAVATENMLIRGAGLAKTSMQSYAGSLSTVVPIASAAGIKFDQIAGAIATLTQHGTSADEATQELANTIRNLQKPNNVAAQAMQQLGLSAIDVMKNLGERGLTGTINLITDAIEKKMGPAGLVAVDAFKKSQSATADLNLEISKMPPQLANLSQQFVAGKIGFTDYRKQIRGMSADQYQLGANFLTTMGQAMGFNTLLRQGAPAAQTFAGYLNQVMGGANGLNTALQLGGENMTYFQNATKQVGKAALDAGSDVLGWNKTQDTLAVKMDKAKASIQVLAVEIGNALIPAVSKIVGWVTSAVDWFENLSGTDKKVLAWSIGIMAALGPVLSIGTKLALVARGAKTIPMSFASYAGASEQAAARIGAATQRISGALAGIGIAFAGEQTGGVAGDVMGALGGALGGASIGSFFGPIGTAVGGLAGGLTGLATAFFGVGHAASAAVKPTDDYTQAILADNDAVGANTRKLVENTLQKQGLYDTALKLGISQKTLTDAEMGNTAAQIAVNAAMVSGNRLLVQSILNHKNLTPAQQAVVDATAKLTAGMGNLNQVLAVNKHAADNLAAADRKTAPALHATGSAASTASINVSGLTKYAGRLSTALKALAGAHVIRVDTSSASSQVGSLQSALNHLYTSLLNPPAVPKPRTGLGTRLVGSATGTNGRGLPEGISAVGERGAELAVKRGSHVEILSNPQSKAFLAATGMRAPGFANGTSPKPLPAATPAPPAEPQGAVFHLYDVNGVLLGTMRGQAQAADADLSRSYRRQGVRAGVGGW